MMSSLFRTREAISNKELLEGVPIPTFVARAHAVDIVANRVSVVVEHSLELFQGRVAGAEDGLSY